MGDTLFTTEDVAKRYGVHPRTVHRWVKEGRIGALNLSGSINGQYRFSQRDIEAFEEKCRVGRG